ncbi:MAG: hypothetical protein HZC01_00455 [Candidatus Kerfeldbacteria bacterium]|nr:hypothetical protein [Candidatus Kerfeldbacteria bacterium]
MSKSTQVQLAELFPKGSGRAPEGTRIHFQPDGLNETVTGTVKKRSGNMARIEFLDPNKSGAPTRVDLPLTQVVTKLG